MIECDAFKLIEELIKNTTDTNNRLLMQTKLHNSNNQYLHREQHRRCSLE